MPAKNHHYTIYWLTVISDFELPEASGVLQGELEAPVYIRRGTTPQELSGGASLGKWFQYNRSQVLLTVPGTARFLFEDGNQILVEMERDVAESDMRAYLLGTGLGTILHQRGLLPLHMSVIDTPSGVVGVAGDSGAGKSTLAAQLHFTNGWPLVSDDVVGLRFIDDEPWVHSGLIRLKLWQDALQRLDIRTDTLVRDHARHDKFHLKDARMFTHKPRRLDKLVILDPGYSSSPMRISGVHAFEAALRAIYRPEIGGLVNSPNAEILLAKLLSTVRNVTVANSRTSGWQEILADQEL